MALPRLSAAPLLPVLALGGALLLAGCGTSPSQAPGGSGRPARPAPAQAPADGRDGPGANPPPDLHRVPDAEPRLEQPRAGGPNKPYEVLGQAYVPATGDPPLVERGLASWYGRKFHGRPTASGEVYNMYAMTAAHKTMPIPSYARIRNPANGREVIVRVNDRGPFHADRVVDLSYTAALKLGVLAGVAPVELERITYEAIRTGSWRRAAGDTALAAAPQPIEGGVADPIADIARRTAAEPPPQAAAPYASDGGPPAAPATGSGPEAARAEAPRTTARGFWLQLGAFRQRESATDLQRRLQGEADWLAPLLAIFNDRSLHRLQAGPYASRGDAAEAAERLRSLLPALPLIVERR